MPPRRIKREIKRSFIQSVVFTGGTRLLSKNPIRRHAWLVVIVLACIALSLHLYYIVEEYRQYAVNTVVENHEFGFQFPDVTICATLPFSRAKIGKEGTGLWNAQRFWHNVLNYNDTLYDTEKSFERATMSFYTFAKDRDIFSGIIENIEHCSYLGEYCNKEDFEIFTTTQRTNCMTFSPKDRSIVISGKRSGLHLILNLGDGFAERDPSFELHDAVGFEVAVHEQSTVFQAEKDITVVEPGKQAIFKLVMKNYTRLNTVTDPCYTEEEIEEYIRSRILRIKGSEKTLNFTKFYTEADCLSLVFMHRTTERCLCLVENYEKPWFENLGYPNCYALPKEFFFNEKIDSEGVLHYRNKTYRIHEDPQVREILSRVRCVEKFLDHSYFNKEIKPLLKNICRSRCKKTNYASEVTFTKWPKSKSKAISTLNVLRAMPEESLNVNRRRPQINNSSEIDRMVSILIFPSDLSVDGTSESLAYPLSQLLADFGGNIGLWIGCSLLTLAELVEFIVRVLSLRLQGSDEAPENEKDMDVNSPMEESVLKENDNLQNVTS